MSGHLAEPMRKRCAVPGCSSGTGNRTPPSVSFHKFPSQNERREMWMKALGLQSDTRRRVCSLHFPEEAFETRLDAVARIGYKRRRLRCDATPTDSPTEPADGAHDAEDLQDDSIDHIFEMVSLHEIAANVEVGALPGLVGATNSALQSDAEIPKNDSHHCEHDYCGKHHAATQTGEMAEAKKQSKGTQTAICVKTLKSQDTQTDWPADVKPGFDVKAAECHCSRADLSSTDVDVRDADFDISMEFSRQTSNIRSSTPVPTSTATHMEQDEAMSPISRPIQALHDKTTDQSYHPSFDESPEDSEAPALLLTDCRKFIVFEESLMQLFKECKVCQSRCTVSTKVTGSLVSVEAVCREQHTYKWHSQPMANKKPAGNALLCAAICFSGASPEKVMRLLKHAGICVPSLSTYYLYQTFIMQPAINRVWEAEQRVMFANFNEAIHLAGDGRCDSPGFSAKYMTYSFMEAKSSKVIHFVQVQLGENKDVQTSNAMEKYGLIKGLEQLKAKDMEIVSLTTDRHPGVKKHMRTNEHGIDHKFDTWHVAKMIKKRLTTESKKSACTELRAWVQPIVNHLYWSVAVSGGDGTLLVAIWKSMLNHVINVHEGHDSPYPRCLHDEIPDGKWLSPGTPAYARLVSVATERTLLTDMAKLSSSAQTSSLESFHSLLTKFAPKSVAFSSEMMRARTQLAILHNNENAGRVQKITESGEKAWKRKLLRSKKGEEVVCPVKTAPTYGYLGRLMEQVVELCHSSSSFREERKKKLTTSSIPLPMSQLRAARPTKQELVSSRQSRFSNTS